MSAEIVQVALTTLASGVLAAAGAYVGVIWKLNSRVSRLEETVESLKSKQNDMESNQKALKADLNKAVSDIREQQEHSTKEIINTIGIVQKEMAEFRVTCSDNRSVMVRKKEFAIFTEEQERRWAEFYRLVGRLEGAMDRLSRNPPALIKSSGNS